MKKSSIKKVSGEIGVVQNTDPFPYEPTSGGGPMSNDILAKMIKNIEKLSNEDHEEIYMTLRRYKQESFFAVNGMGTHFNIDGLTDQVKWNLHRVISLSLDNKTRIQTLQNATNEHSDHMKKQYDLMHSEVEWVDEVRNPSEEDKTSYMLELNSLNQNKFGIRRDLVIT